MIKMRHRKILLLHLSLVIATVTACHQRLDMDAMLADNPRSVINRRDAPTYYEEVEQKHVISNRGEHQHVIYESDGTTPKTVIILQPQVPLPPPDGGFPSLIPNFPKHFHKHLQHATKFLRHRMKKLHKFFRDFLGDEPVPPVPLAPIPPPVKIGVPAVKVEAYEPEPPKLVKLVHHHHPTPVVKYVEDPKIVKVVKYVESTPIRKPGPFVYTKITPENSHLREYHAPHTLIKHVEGPTVTKVVEYVESVSPHPESVHVKPEPVIYSKGNSGSFHPRLNHHHHHHHHPHIDPIQTPKVVKVVEYVESQSPRPEPTHITPEPLIYSKGDSRNSHPPFQPTAKSLEAHHVDIRTITPRPIAYNTPIPNQLQVVQQHPSSNFPTPLPSQVIHRQPDLPSPPQPIFQQTHNPPSHFPQGHTVYASPPVYPIRYATPPPPVVYHQQANAYPVPHQNQHFDSAYPHPQPTYTQSQLYGPLPIQHHSSSIYQR